MAENKVRIEDHEGNIYYPHTKSDVVFMADGTTAEAHKNNKSNPHAVTKTQVGLGSVENYSVATQAEAEAGTSSAKYMTPQRTKQAIDKNLTPLQEKVNAHLAQVTTQFVAVSRDLSLTGTQVVAGFIDVPDYLEIRAFVSGTPKHSIGGVYRNSQAVLYVANDEKTGGWSGASIVLADNTGGVNTRGEITINNDKTITITWIKGNGGTLGTAVLQIVAHFHGGDE